MGSFQNFVKENEIWFRGRLPETDETLMNVESKLGVKLPEDIKWLLKDYGYWHGTGISNIEESIDDTLMAREHVNLPNNFVVLYDHQDGGVILLDTNKLSGKYRVISAGWESIPDQIENEIIFSDFEEYTKSVIETEREIIAECDIECKE